MLLLLLILLLVHTRVLCLLHVCRRQETSVGRHLCVARPRCGVADARAALRDRDLQLEAGRPSGQGRLGWRPSVCLQVPALALRARWLLSGGLACIRARRRRFWGRRLLLRLLARLLLLGRWR